MPESTVVTKTRLIRGTGEPLRHPWPEKMFIQGGAVCRVFTPDGGDFETAFVEAFPPGTFLRGEGPTIEAAEASCWAQLLVMQKCSAAPVHGPFDARRYRTGAGYCTCCGVWFSPDYIQQVGGVFVQPLD